MLKFLNNIMCKNAFQSLLKIIVLLLCSLAFSQTSAQGRGLLPAAKIKKSADEILAIMSYSVVPDLTSSFLSIQDDQVGQNRMFMTQFAGGETISKKVPVYLEGSAAFMRFDPVFVAERGQDFRSVPARWNSVALSGGVGYDFPIAPNLVLRPIFNFSLAHLESDASLAGRFIDDYIDPSLDFLKRGRLNAYGLGGSLMLDYTLVKPEHEIDLELRYTNIRLRTFDSSAVVSGSASAEAASVYARYRAPTGLQLMDNPLRYVLEAANTVYLGDQRGLLGFNNLTSVGVGIEFDSSKYKAVVTRTRLVARYAFGDNVRGFAIGLAVSF
ncbi:hypothetical protein [Zwartia panacis]|uniref:hypothetical protein n=1 Tax=Zwartia panacis TaxID=2683345 RepID=UPI0025B4E908|nr:hypothetical protein [Zwartia panacis]MDN4016103.1 hypothetical protein [Zwartia panacis]